MEAVVLAGGPMPPALAEFLQARGQNAPSERALVSLAGRPILERVLSSLEDVTPVTSLLVVGPPGIEAFLEARRARGGERTPTRFLVERETLSANLLDALRAVSGARALVVTGDAPLCQGRTWMQFLDGAQVNLLEAAYAIVRREQMEAQFPGATRTYAPLRGTSFTGGNAFLLPLERIDHIEEWVQIAFNARKEPWKLASALGWSFVARGLTKRLSLAEVESKISRLLDCRAGAVIVPDAAIAFDIDKPADLERAEAMLAESSS